MPKDGRAAVYGWFVENAGPKTCRDYVVLQPPGRGCGRSLQPPTGPPPAWQGRHGGRGTAVRVLLYRCETAHVPEAAEPRRFVFPHEAKSAAAAVQESVLLPPCLDTPRRAGSGKSHSSPFSYTTNIPMTATPPRSPSPQELLPEGSPAQPSNAFRLLSMHHA